MDALTDKMQGLKIKAKTKDPPRIITIPYRSSNEVVEITIQPKRIWPRRQITYEESPDEALEGMRVWYAERGQEIPEEDLEFYRQMRLAEAEAATKAEAATANPVVSDTKPEFGTPEFWAWARRRKAEKNAELAAAGLPPLPTTAEKAATKAAKASEKVAKAEAKAAK